MSIKNPFLSRRSFALVMTTGAACAMTGLFGGCTSSMDLESKDEVQVTNNPETQDGTSGISPFPQGAVCVSEYLNNTLAIIDIELRKIIGRIPLNSNPTTMARNSEKLYVGSSGGGKIIAIPLSNTKLSNYISVGYQPHGLCIDEERNLLFVADYMNSGIHVVDTTLDSMIQTIALKRFGYQNRTDPPACCLRNVSGGTGRRSVSLALSPDASILYCANFGTYDIARIDLETNTELEPFDGVVSPRTLLMTKNGKHLLLAGVGGDVEEKESCLYVIDCKSGARIFEVPVGVGVSDVCQTENGETVLALARDDGTLVLFDSATWEERARITLDVGVDALALSGDESKILVSNGLTGALFIIDRNTLEVSGHIQGLINPKNILAL